MKQLFFTFALFALPSLVFAAGFVQAPIFLSNNPVTAGEKVRVYTIVSNDATTTFNGTVAILVDDVRIGAPTTTLSPGGTQTVSANWTPTEPGGHTITAQLTTKDGAVVQEVSKAFTVEKPPSPPVASSSNPPKAAQATSSIESSSQIVNSISNISPTIGSYSAPIFNTIDGGRTIAAKKLNESIDWSKSQIGSTIHKNGVGNTIWKVIGTALLYVLTVLLYIIKTPGLFYLVFVVIFFYILWRCYRRFRRR